MHKKLSFRLLLDKWYRKLRKGYIYSTRTYIFNLGALDFAPSNLAKAACPAILASLLGSCLFGASATLEVDASVEGDWLLNL